MTVVEIGLMGVKPDHDVLNPKTPEGQVLDLAWSTVTTAPGGPYWAYGGIEPDDTLRLWCFFCFDDVKHHMDFAKTGGAEAVKDLPQILSHPIFGHHVQLDGEARDVLNAPVVEVTLLYFSPDITDAEKEGISKTFSTGIGGDLDSNTDMRAVRSGWSVERDWPMLEGREKGEGTGTVFSILVGWSGVEAQKKSGVIQGLVGKLGTGGNRQLIHSATKLVECREFGTART
ncbi:hypothetical protein AA0114_g9132 [Alternaria tenuissima]|uniref:Uncharacterized protein n=1 Tax=Alternaria tenuissima TaxID=119927 RepID=A0A4Q4M8Q2_9PLEO|nr:hypothetical protein AALT_g9166 [Alternaria alternata]RYN45429.1 hypothetical protein AA0114_g9132 [Alternaria tenuissima]